MSVHFLYRFHEHAEFLLLHPLSPKVAHDEVRELQTRIFGPARGIHRDDAPLLFRLLRFQDLTICQACQRRLPCPAVAWDDSWLARTRLTVAPTADKPEPEPPWKLFFDGIFAKVMRGEATVEQARSEVGEYEKLLSLVAPYTDQEIVAAHKRAIMVHHSDHGGDDKLAARINVARDALRRLQAM